MFSAYDNGVESFMVVKVEQPKKSKKTKKIQSKRDAKKLPRRK